MRTIGLIGGTTWLSTIDYYRIINQEVNRQLGDLHSAKLLLCSIDFDEFKALADAGDWSTGRCQVRINRIKAQHGNRLHHWCRCNRQGAGRLSE